MQQRLTGKALAIRLQIYVSDPVPNLLNDPDRRLRYRSCGPDLNQLNQLEQQLTQQISAARSCNARAGSINAAPRYAESLIVLD